MVPRQWNVWWLELRATVWLEKKIFIWLVIAFYQQPFFILLDFLKKNIIVRIDILWIFEIFMGLYYSVIINFWISEFSNYSWLPKNLCTWSASYQVSSIKLFIDKHLYSDNRKFTLRILCVINQTNNNYEGISIIVAKDLLIINHDFLNGF